MGDEASVRNAWSVAPRVMRNHTMDSTRWYDFRYRDGDIVIGTWAKTGTTWLQQIVGQLVFGPVEGLPVFDYSPWIEHRCFDKGPIFRMLEAQTHRRFVKTHLPADALVFSGLAKYIYIGRDGRDTLWSWYNHHRNLTPVVYEMMEGTPGLVGPMLEPPTEDVREYFHDWLDRDGFPLWPFWSHVQSWWDLRDRPNVLLVHFADLRRDLAGEIRRIAAFLGIALEEETLPRICEYCSFGYMKAHPEALARMLRGALKGGTNAFMHQGNTGKWRSVLTPADVAKYERYMAGNLTPDCARWLTCGSFPADGGTTDGRRE
jgi:aryl sulfotransferase